jgi:hypothetical protein
MNLIQLPHDILLHIFKYIEDEYNLLNLVETCKTLTYYKYDPGTWTKFYKLSRTDISLLLKLDYPIYKPNLFNKYHIGCEIIVEFMYSGVILRIGKVGRLSYKWYRYQGEPEEYIDAEEGEYKIYIIKNYIPKQINIKIEHPTQGKKEYLIREDMKNIITDVVLCWNKYAKNDFEI